jgi:hypothetical protein
LPSRSAARAQAFGGLLFSLKKAGALKFWGPAYTVHLEVSYKSKITAGALVLASAEVESVEGRKLWMRATMSGARHSRGAFVGMLARRAVPRA